MRIYHHIERAQKNHPQIAQMTQTETTTGQKQAGASIIGLPLSSKSE
jgi:hypothetical protein